MTLDCLSEKGKVAIEHSRRALELIGRKFVETKQDSIADIDGFFLNDGNEIVASYEIKARNMSLVELEENFGNEWLITYDKIVKGCAVSKSLHIPFFGILYLVKDDSALLIRISDANGELCPKVRIYRSTTQATVNGGEAARVNAYIDMTHAKQFSV